MDSDKYAHIVRTYRPACIWHVRVCLCMRASDTLTGSSSRSKMMINISFIANAWLLCDRLIIGVLSPANKTG